MSLLTLCVSGISLRFATNLFRSWLEERDMASIVKSLKTAQLDTRLLVCIEWPENTAQVNIEYGLYKRKGVFEHAPNAELDSSHFRAKTHLGICSPLIHSLVSNDSVSGQQRPRSACTDGLQTIHMKCQDLFSLKTKKKKKKTNEKKNHLLHTYAYAGVTGF